MKLYGTPRKNIFFFFEMFWKDGLAKKSHWSLIFLVLLGSMIFIFPENMILFFRRKMKDDLKKKIHGNMMFSSNVLKGWSFQKNSYLNMIFFCNIWKDGISFFPKMWYFFFRRKVKDDLYQKIHGNMAFSGKIHLKNDISEKRWRRWYWS